MPSRRVPFRSQTTTPTNSAAPAIVASSTGRNASGSGGRTSEGEQRGERGDEQRDLRGRRDRDLAREPDLAAPRDHDRAAVLGRVPDDGDDHGADEELRQTDRVGERPRACATRISLTTAVDAGRDGEHDERVPQAPASAAGGVFAAAVR